MRLLPDACSRVWRKLARQEMKEFLPLCDATGLMIKKILNIPVLRGCYKIEAVPKHAVIHTG
jgi:hypothetical protein